MKRFPLITILIVASALIAPPSQTLDLGKLSYKLFDDIEAQLDPIEKSAHAGAAAAEIRLAKNWLAKGRELLSEGSLKRAAKFAERLPLQLELIRTLLATGSAVKEAEVALKKNHLLQKNLKALKLRIHRYTLAYDGAVVTHAVPPLSGSTK